MPHKIEHPEITEVNSPTTDWKATHPAFGQIVVVRTSSGGGNHLYGTDHSHHYTYTLAIYGSELHRHLANDRYHSTEKLIAIEMTEDQFNGLASFVGQGEGVPCTLRWTPDKGYLPDLPRPGNKADLFRSEIERALNKSREGLEAVMKEIESLPGVSAKRKQELTRKLSSASHGMVSNATFVAEQFDEHIERVTARASASLAAQSSRTALPSPAEDDELQPTALPAPTRGPRRIPRRIK